MRLKNKKNKKIDTNILLALLQKTNDFIVLTSVRYSIEAGVYTTEKEIVIQDQFFSYIPKPRTFNLVVLTDYLFNNTIEKGEKQKIADVSKLVGYVREYLIYSLQGLNDKLDYLDKKVVNDSMKKMNIEYKLFLDEIIQNNRMGDFLLKKQVKEKLSGRAQIISHPFIY